MGQEPRSEIIAPRLALEGKERDEIVSRLGDEYDLGDPDALVEDVLSRLA